MIVDDAIQVAIDQLESDAEATESDTDAADWIAAASALRALQRPTETLVPFHEPEGCPTCEFRGTLSLVGGKVHDIYTCEKGFVVVYGPQEKYLSNTGHGGGLTVGANGWRAILYQTGDPDTAER